MPIIKQSDIARKLCLSLVPLLLIITEHAYQRTILSLSSKVQVAMNYQILIRDTSKRLIMSLTKTRKIDENYSGIHQKTYTPLRMQNR